MILIKRILFKAHKKRIPFHLKKKKNQCLMKMEAHIKIRYISRKNNKNKNSIHNPAGMQNKARQQQLKTQQIKIKLQKLTII